MAEPTSPQTTADLLDAEIARLRDALEDARRHEQIGCLLVDLLSAANTPKDVQDAAWVLLRYVTSRAATARQRGLAQEVGHAG